MIKVCRIRAVVWWMQFFILGSLFFIYLINSLFRGVSIFYEDGYMSFIRDYQLLFIFSAIVSLSCLKLLKVSRYLIIMFNVLIIIITCKLLLDDFNKLILVLNTLYFVISFYFSLNWWKELDDVIYNPLFSSYNVDLIPRMNIPVRISFIGGQSDNYQGFMSNWGDDQCFIILDRPIPLSAFKKVVLEIPFEQFTFLHHGEVCTLLKNRMGIGVQLKKNRDDSDYNESLNWNHFYEVVQQRGYTPEYLY